MLRSSLPSFLSVEMLCPSLAGIFLTCDLNPQLLCQKASAVLSSQKLVSVSGQNSLPGNGLLLVLAQLATVSHLSVTSRADFTY